LNRGLLFKFEGNFPKALEHYYRSLKIARKIDDQYTQAYCYNNIGRVYVDLDEKNLALKYYRLSLELKLKLNDQSGIAESYNNIGVIYGQKGMTQEAIKYYKKGLDIHEKSGYKVGEAYICNNLGNIYQKSDSKLALSYFLRCLDIRKELGDKKGISQVYLSFGAYYVGKGDLNKGLEYYKEGLNISKELGYPYLIEKHALELSKIYNTKKQFQQSLEMYKLHVTMRDSINNESTQRAAVQQQAKYEYEKQKALDDAQYEKQIAIEQEAKEKQTILTYAAGGGLGLVGIFLIFVFNRLQVTRKQKNIIEAQKLEVEKQKEVVDIAHHELEEKNKEITDSIQYAKRIQSAILPPIKQVKKYLQDSFILYKPKDIVAGDFYWMESVSFRHSGLNLESPKNKSVATQNEIAGQASNADIILFAAADCTGHGVPGAMVSVVCNNGLNRSVREFGLTDPGEILNKAREIVVQEFEKSEEEVRDGMDIALCSLRFNVQDSKLYESEIRNLRPETVALLQYAGANNPLWIIRKGANEIEETKANKQPIGQFENLEPYTTHSIELQKGDSIYIFSDGYADQFGGEKGKKLKSVNFKKLLLSIQKEDMQTQKQLIDVAFENWKGEQEQVDDVCIIGVKI
jgi:serine phosphatase RsbU (regulator of sigma subunit)